MIDKNRNMIALSLEMIRIGKRMEAEKRELERLLQAGVSYESPRIRDALNRYLREKYAWENAEQAYLALRDNK